MSARAGIYRGFDESIDSASVTSGAAVLAPATPRAEHARLRAAYAGRLDAPAVREALAEPSRPSATWVADGPSAPTARADGVEDVALWYVPFLAATLLALLAIEAFGAWVLMR